MYVITTTNRGPEDEKQFQDMQVHYVEYCMQLTFSCVYIEGEMVRRTVPDELTVPLQADCRQGKYGTNDGHVL